MIMILVLSTDDQTPYIPIGEDSFLIRQRGTYGVETFTTCHKPPGQT